MFVFLLGMICVFVSFTQNIIDTQTFIKLGETDVEEAIETSFPHKENIKELYGWANKFLSPSELDRVVKDEDGFLMPMQYTGYNTAHAAGKLAELRDVCVDNNVGFAYVSYPSKSDSSDRTGLYGIDSNVDEKRADFLKELDEYGVEVLNIRNQLESQGLNRKDVFYKTDHHWNTKSGLFAARSITQFLCDKGYNTKPELLDADQFSYDEYQECWLGEGGRKYSVTWVGSLDDFTVIKPTYDTSLEYIVQNDFEKSGDFSILLDESNFGNDYDLYTTSLHYSYMPYAGLNTIVRNNYFEDGAKVLLVKDSFSIVVTPFLALGCGEVNMWDVRGHEDSLYEYIKNNDFDIVLVAYTDYFSDAMYAFY
jgi:hypothetical protein